MAVENWLLKMEKLLRAFECTDAQKMVYATFALQVLLKDGGQALSNC